MATPQKNQKCANIPKRTSRRLKSIILSPEVSKELQDILGEPSTKRKKPTAKRISINAAEIEKQHFSNDANNNKEQPNMHNPTESQPSLPMQILANPVVYESVSPVNPQVEIQAVEAIHQNAETSVEPIQDFTIKEKNLDHAESLEIISPSFFTHNDHALDIFDSDSRTSDIGNSKIEKSDSSSSSSSSSSESSSEEDEQQIEDEERKIPAKEFIPIHLTFSLANDEKRLLNELGKRYEDVIKGELQKMDLEVTNLEHKVDLILDLASKAKNICKK